MKERDHFEDVNTDGTEYYASILETGCWGAKCINLAQHKDLGGVGCCDHGNERHGSI